MKRDIEQLSDRAFDVLVVGAGINGACVAYDAAQRGLSVAVVDRGDFVSNTSFNSLRIVHGGLRYIQHLDFKRMRQSIRERSFWLRAAPHLIRPMACMMPTKGLGIHSRAAFRAAFLVNDLIGWDRNRGLAEQQRIPAGRLISRSQARDMYPGMDAAHITGGAVWHDARMLHSERVVLAVLESARDVGAVTVNYAAVTGVEVSGGRIARIDCRDELFGQAFAIRAELVINACGPGVTALVRKALGGASPCNVPPLSSAMNILTRRIADDVAVAVPGKRPGSAADDQKTRMLFVTPWRGLSLIGTTHERFDGDPETFRPTTREVGLFLEEINTACPEAKLTLDDVRFVFAGLLPAEPPRPGESEVRLLRHHRVIDHAETDGLANLISLVGVKYTTARLVAQQVGLLATGKLGKGRPRCETHLHPLSGGDEPSARDGTERLKQQASGLEDALADELFRQYGTRASAVVALALESGRTDRASIVEAQTRFACRHEMAFTLADIVYRRTDLAGAGLPDDATIERVAGVAAEELGWSEEKTADEIAQVRSYANRWKTDVAE